MPKKPDISEEFLQTRRAIVDGVAGRICARRKELGLSLSGLQESVQLFGIHITRMRLSRIEKGIVEPKASELIALAEALDVRYEWILEGVKEK